VQVQVQGQLQKQLQLQLQLQLQKQMRGFFASLRMTRVIAWGFFPFGKLRVRMTRVVAVVEEEGWRWRL
jgi:hypothetical protein